MSSDRGVQFTSELWSALSNLLGIKLHCTTSYHPQANGLVERFHRHMKSALKARLVGPGWVDQLGWILLGIRTAPKADLGTSSAELVYGAPITVPGDFLATPSDPPNPAQLLPRLREAVAKLTPTPTSRHCLPKNSVPASLSSSAYVFVRRGAACTPLQRPYEGPFRVIAPGEKTFKIDRGGKQEIVSIDRLKPAHLDLDQPVRVAQPPRRGRPPTGPPQSAQAPTDTIVPSTNIFERRDYV